MSRTWQSDPVDLQNRLCNQITQLRAEVERLRAEVSRWKTAYKEAREIARTALEPKP